MPSNQFLIEVLCAVRFDPAKNDWNTEYFNKFYSLIFSRGYIDKREQRQVEIQFQAGSAVANPLVKEQGQPRMVFSNPTLNSAIIMSEHFISFHKLAPYENWDSLIKNIVDPGLKDYENIGLGKSVIEVQCLYLNKYNLGEDESLGKYFNFLPVIENTPETQIVFQGIYNSDPANTIQLKLNSIKQSLSKDTFLECSSFARPRESNEDFTILATRAHDSANKAYNSIIKQ